MDYGTFFTGDAAKFHELFNAFVHTLNVRFKHNFWCETAPRWISDGTKYWYRSISVEILGIGIGIFQPIPGIGYKMQLHVKIKENWNIFTKYKKK